MSEALDLNDIEGARKEAYTKARAERGTHIYMNAESEQRKVRYTRPMTSGTTMAGLEDLEDSHHTPGYWYDSPAEGGAGVRFKDEKATPD